MTEQSTFCDNSSTRAGGMMADDDDVGRIALSVTAVSTSVSPLVTEEVATFMFMTSAPRLARHFEGGLRSGRGFKEEIDQRAPVEDVALLAVLPDVIGGLVGKIEHKIDLIC